MIPTRRFNYQPQKKASSNKSSKLLSFFGFYFFGEKGGLKKFLIRNALIFGSAFIILCFIIFVWVSRDLPDPQKINQQQITESTVIYDRTGTNILYDLHGDVKRTVVPLSEMSDYIKQATIAIEDQSFYKHHGINIKGVFRALFNDLLGKNLQGGSSITQQLIKNSMLTSERTITRKIKEAILAVAMEQKFSKDQILEMYLNQIPYGGSTYGVEAASQTYFNTSAKNLTIAQAATIAAMAQAPTYYSPYGSHPEELKRRQELVIDDMAKLGFITKDEADTAKKTKLTFANIQENIIAPHFVMYIKEQLEQKFDKKLVTQGGLKVYTSLDLNIQRAAEEAVRNNADKNARTYNAHNAALVATDPKTGQILAMVGSENYFDQENDGNVNVAIRDRQPGSSFKPIVYAAAFQKGYTPDTVLADTSINFSLNNTDYIPGDYDGKQRGPIKMKEALAMSLNIPAVETLYLTGTQNAIDLAHKMGITTLNNPQEQYGLSLVLGGGEVKLLDEVYAYGVFANEGIKYPLASILKVEDKNGNVLLDNTKQNGEKVLDEEVARQITSILSDNSLRAPIFGLNSYLKLSDREAAAKTGTTQDYRDAWIVGYTPSLAAGVWAGNNNNAKMINAPGVSAAGPIWKDFMEKVLAGTPKEEFIKPQPVTTSKPILNGVLPEETIKVDKETNKLVPDNCDQEVKTTDKRFVDFHSILYYVNKDDPRGDGTGMDDPQFASWEDGVKKWIDANAQTPETDGVLYKKPDPLVCNKDDVPKLDFDSLPDSVRPGSTIDIKVSVDAKNSIKKVEFYAKNDLIKVFKDGSPYEYIYLVPQNISDDQIRIEARAYDKYNNMGRTRKDININK